MLPIQYPQQYFVFAGTRTVRDEERQEERDLLRLLPRRVGWAALLGLVIWPLCFVAIATLDHLLGHRDNHSLQSALSIPWVVGICAAPTVALALLSEIRKDWIWARKNLNVEQIERWERRPEAELDEEDEETWELPVWVEVIANTTTIWDEEYDDEEEDDDEELGNEGNPWGTNNSPWNG